MMGRHGTTQLMSMAVKLVVMMMMLVVSLTWTMSTPITHGREWRRLLSTEENHSGEVSAGCGAARRSTSRGTRWSTGGSITRLSGGQAITSQEGSGGPGHFLEIVVKVMI